MTSIGGRFFTRVYDVVRQIPRGRVATYGQVAALLGSPHGARAVGWALRALAPALERSVPWHRVVGAGGRISPRGGAGPLIQRHRLRAEGVRLRRGVVDLERHGVASPLGRPAGVHARRRRTTSKANRRRPAAGEAPLGPAA